MCNGIEVYTIYLYSNAKNKSFLQFMQIIKLISHVKTSKAILRLGIVVSVFNLYSRNNNFANGLIKNSNLRTGCHQL